MRIYLAGPINGCTDDEAIDWREDIKITLKNHFPDEHLQFVDPMVRDYRGVENSAYREIVDLDKRDIRTSDVVVVGYSKPSVGTSMETFFAWTLGKPIVVLTKEGTTLSPWLKYHSTQIAYNINDVVDFVEKCL